MFRPLLGVLSAAAVLTVAVSGAPAAQSHASKSSQASVGVADCHPSDLTADRYAAFNGQMRAIPGTKRMAMRFRLLERLGRTRYKAVRLADLKPWRYSKAGARTFIYAQRVTALHDNGAYRMRVQFRWYAAHHRLLRSTSARSRTCRQPAPLPDLTVTSISSMAGISGQRMYSLTVANDGQGEARHVPVTLKVDGTVVGGSIVDLLPAQESSVVQIAGPQCAFTVRAIANPDRLISETDTSNNALTVPCAQATS
jgi:CARDB